MQLIGDADQAVTNGTQNLLADLACLLVVVSFRRGDVGRLIERQVKRGEVMLFGRYRIDAGTVGGVLAVTGSQPDGRVKQKDGHLPVAVLTYELSDVATMLSCLL